MKVHNFLFHILHTNFLKFPISPQTAIDTNYDFSLQFLVFQQSTITKIPTHLTLLKAKKCVAEATHRKTQPD